VPWGILEDLGPRDFIHEIGGRGYNTNRLVISGSANLVVSGSYVGAAYVFNGPADSTASPQQLGYRRGDHIRLIGPSGGEPHDGMLLTFDDPSAISVMEVLDPSDTTEYYFKVFRRVG
jgi:hypothetical protein